jgi:hypothetical protein
LIAGIALAKQTDLPLKTLVQIALDFFEQMGRAKPFKQTFGPTWRLWLV